VSFTARIRPDHAEEILECATSRKAVFLSEAARHIWRAPAMDAALPYYPGTQPVFVSALIRHALVLPNNNFRYGVMYAATNRAAKS